MAAGLTPDEVNSRLKKVKGYAKTNLVIWNKIKEAIPELEFEWRGYEYSNTAVLKAIEDNSFCLVEVDYDNLEYTKDKHWVLFIGNKKMLDPWTGQEYGTPKYKIPTGYAVIKRRKYMSDELETCLKEKDVANKDREKFWKERDQWKSDYEKLKKEYDNAKEDYLVQQTGLQEECKQQKKKYDELVAALAEIFNTTQDPAKIRAEAVKAIEFEDQLIKVRNKNYVLTKTMGSFKDAQVIIFGELSKHVGFTVRTLNGALKAIGAILNNKNNKEEVEMTKHSTEWLAGYKTYLVAGMVAAVVVGLQLGLISSEVATTLLGLLGAGGLTTLRLGIKKLE
jgi:hypothetical protein